MKPNLNYPLIHIGYHKTATTWLQKMLFISENDVFEPFSKTSGGQSTLARYFIYDDEGYILSPFDDNKIRIHKEIEAIKSNTSRFNSKIAVISHERLSGNPHSSGFDSKKIAFMLKEHFPESKILIVIREQRSMILSLYFQYLTIGGTHNLTKYLSTKYDGRRPFFAPKNLAYLPLITEYYKLFGKDNVLVLPFEIFRNNPSQFIVFLGDFLNVRLAVKSSQFEVVLNKKPYPFVMYYLRFLNVFRRTSSLNNYSSLSNRYSKKVADFVYFNLGKFLPNQLNNRLNTKLKTEIDKWCGDRYVESNKKISELTGIDLSSFGYY